MVGVGKRARGKVFLAFWATFSLSTTQVHSRDWQVAAGRQYVKNGCGGVINKTLFTKTNSGPDWQAVPADPCPEEGRGMTCGICEEEGFVEIKSSIIPHTDFISTG